MFVLTEILRSRGSQRTTYTAFIDVKKAYDTVWRNGLWKRMWDEGERKDVESSERNVQRSTECGVRR